MVSSPYLLLSTYPSVQVDPHFRRPSIDAPRKVATLPPSSPISNSLLHFFRSVASLALHRPFWRSSLATPTPGNPVYYVCINCHSEESKESPAWTNTSSASCVSVCVRRIK
ncbi:hypothetical protein NPIL_506761 [Nephila pilipes]|uniref:Uncharacterized protein n=1 Tax=Nephila pilipes TaxID=299642 RepID=A0A8X6QED6_NEPPI|nr:hypothetical protein NPIL_506761 [Nephila pilipes]